LAPTWITSGAAISGSGTINYLARWTPTGTQLGIGATYDDGINVGIGTNSPSSKLHVFGTDINIQSTGGNFKTGYTVKTALNEWFIGQEGTATSGFRITDIDAATPRFQIDQTGNVGIGTTAPMTKLHVAGTNPSSIVNQVAENTTSSIQSGIIIQRSRGTVAIPTVISSGDQLGGFYMMGYDGTSFGSSGPAAGISAIAAQSFSAGTGTDMFFSTSNINATSASTKMIITANGNVGIGTSTNPNQKLEVQDGNILLSNTATQSELRFKEANANGGQFVSFKAPASLASNVDYTLPIDAGTANAVLSTNGTGTLSWQNISGTLSGGTINYLPKWTSSNSLSSTSKIYDDGTHVGIGTTTTNSVGTNTTALTISAADAYSGSKQVGLELRGSEGTANTMLGQINFVHGSGLTEMSRIESRTGNTNITHGQLAFFTNYNDGFNERMRISDEGNVGIGTAIPSTQLHVVGGARVTGLVGPGTVVADATGLLSIAAGGTITGSGTTNHLARWTSGTQLGIGATYDNGTNVGIGTTNPMANLHVSGAANSPTLASISASVASLGTQRFQFSSGDVLDVGFQSTPVYAAWMQSGYNGTAEHILLNPLGGNVGIGNTSPTTQLHVQGGARITNLVGPGTVIADASGNLSIATGGTITGSGTANYVTRWTPTGTQLGTGLIYDNNSVVGIGTGASPSASRLHVHSTSGNGNFRLTSASTLQSATDGFSMSNDGTTAIFMTQHENADWYFATNGGTTAMTIRPTGNIGIGTTTAANKLDVEGAAVIGSTYSGTNTGPVNGLLVEGNVGIGTTSPSAKLEVVGDIEIPAANDYIYTTAKTNYSSISPVGFIPESSTYFRNSVSGYIHLSGGTFPNTGEIHAPVNLPNGAVITEVRFYIYDNDATYDFIYLQLFRYTMSSGASIFSSVTIPTGTFALSSYAATPNYVVDNSLYQYQLRVGMPQNSANHRLYGVRITYTITKAD
jgi:hypothetical protein